MTYYGHAGPEWRPAIIRLVAAFTSIEAVELGGRVMSAIITQERSCSQELAIAGLCERAGYRDAPTGRLF